MLGLPHTAQGSDVSVTGGLARLTLGGGRTSSFVGGGRPSIFSFPPLSFVLIHPPLARRLPPSLNSIRTL